MPYLINGTAAPLGPDPPSFVDKQWEGLKAPGPDLVLPGRSLGLVLKQPEASYFLRSKPNETVVNVTFYGANPRQSLRRGGTFLEVQHQTTAGSWETIANDDALSTRLYWEKVEVLTESAGAETQPAAAAATAAGVFEIPKHLVKAFEVAERVSGRSVSTALLAECLAKGGVGHCGYTDVSEPSPVATVSSSA